MAKVVKRGMFLEVYVDLVNLSPKVLSGSKNEPLMVETFLYEIIDLSEVIK
jgi:hypothetical protein